MVLIQVLFCLCILKPIKVHGNGEWDGGQAGPKLSYKGKVDVFIVAIDKDLYSLVEFLYYTKDLGYSNIKEFYCQHIDGEELLLISFDTELLDFEKNLKNSDELDVFLLHGTDEYLKVVSQSSLLLEGPPECSEKDDIGSDGNEDRGLDKDLNDYDSIGRTDLVDEDVVVGIVVEVMKASFEVMFKEELDYMSQLGMQSKDLVGDLLHYPRQSWVRAFVNEDCKCDAVENNMRETFTSWILVPRNKSIITMLEDIKRKIMSRTVNMLGFPIPGYVTFHLWLDLYWRRIRTDLRLARVRNLKAAATSTFCGDTRIPVTERINSQLPPRNRETVGHRRGGFETTIDIDCGGSKRSKNAGFKIYISPRGTQRLNGKGSGLGSSTDLRYPPWPGPGLVHDKFGIRA
ncbi:hypothetical protein FXO38_19525 [Capsicum annuum]|nr:hypothetical protein FXO38_19525 [Capsicum annuum]